MDVFILSSQLNDGVKRKKIVLLREKKQLENNFKIVNESIEKFAMFVGIKE